MTARRRWPRALAVASLVAVAAVGAGVAWDALSSGPQRPSVVVRSTELRLRVSAEGILEAVKSTPLTAPVTAPRPMKLAWIVADGQPVTADQVVFRFDPTELEKEREDGLSERRIADRRLGTATVEGDAALTRIERKAEVAGVELKNAREFSTRDERLYSRLEIIESTIDTELAEARFDHAAAEREVRKQLLQADRELLTIHRDRAALTVSQAEDGLAALEVRAPHAGIFVHERDWRGEAPRVGDTFWPGRPLASLPDLDEMQAVVYVLEADAGSLEPGQAVTVILEAHPEAPVTGEVASVDPVAQQRVRGNPAQYFRCVVSLARTDPELMKPGARVRAEIVVAEYDSVVTVPRHVVEMTDDQPVVDRWDGDRFVPVPVELGPSLGGRVVVTGGLDDGDRIGLPAAETAGREGSSGAGSPLPGSGR